MGSLQQSRTTVVDAQTRLRASAPDWTRTSTPEKAQALNLPRIPIPPPGLWNHYTLAPLLVNPAGPVWGAARGQEPGLRAT
jgi:hypothetical protein